MYYSKVRPLLVHLKTCNYLNEYNYKKEMVMIFIFETLKPFHVRQHLIDWSYSCSPYQVLPG